MGNDDDLNGDSLFITAVGNPANGTATINGSTVVYTPTLGFVGTDNFIYTVSDGVSNSTGTVIVTVNARAV